MKGTQKAPMSKDAIYRLMLILVYIVTIVYLLKNLIGKSMGSAMIIGICLLVFSVMVLLMKKLKVQDENKYMAVAMSLVVLVFLISISSGEYYSDDYCLYVTVMAISGLYMVPRITKVQSVVIPVVLVVQYLLHPEKVESRSQFIMCLAIFTLAAYLMYLLVNRGKAFIDIGETRADEAEKLTASMKAVGEELHVGMQNTREKYEELDGVNKRMAADAEELRRGSAGISQGTLEVVSSCDEVQLTIRDTEEQIESLNGEVSNCEAAIRESHKSLKDMGAQLQTVQQTIRNANEVFALMENQMQEIFAVLEELNKIASSTTILALNASVEAARAGEAGAGFAVVASKVQDLAVDSTACSKKVGVVLHSMQEKVNETTEQLRESMQAVEGSDASLNELRSKFDGMMEGFEKLYGDIDKQNENIHCVEQIFDSLKDKIAGMNVSSEENREVVESMTVSMEMYQKNLQGVIDDSKSVSQISESMLKAAIEG